LRPPHSKAIAFTAYNRVGYLANVLETWRGVKGLQDWYFYASVEPSPQQDAIVNLFTQFYRDMGMSNCQIAVNKRKQGVLHHPWVVIDQLFNDGSDFVVRVEDDLTVADDFLLYMEWASEQFQDKKDIAAVIGYTKDFQGTEDEVIIRPEFSPLNWGTWRDRWDTVIRDTWDHDYSTFNGKPGNECVPLNTEILTKRGWLSWDAVRVGDETIGYNRDSNRSEWTKVVNVVRPFTSEVVSLFSDSKPFVCTPGHTWLVLDKYRNIKSELVVTKDLSGQRPVVTSIPACTPDGLDITNSEAGILGWIAGDGSYSFYGDGKLKASLSQAKVENFPGIEELFKDVPHSVYNHKGVRTWYLHKAYALDLMTRAGNPKTSSFESVLQMSDSQRVTWLSAFDLAEGTDHGSKRRLYQVVGNTSDAAQLAVYLEGHRPSRNRIDRGRENEHPYHQIHYANPNCTAYPIPMDKEELVWCVTTELGTWTARQNDSVVLTGNSGWDWNLNTRVLPARNLSCVYPAQSRVQNIGINGTHSVENYTQSLSFKPSYGEPEYRLGR